jgi:hypothetical protein
MATRLLISMSCLPPLLQVLSSTEVGDLLMWDGGLIKAVIRRKNKAPCHNGQVSRTAALYLHPVTFKETHIGVRLEQRFASIPVVFRCQLMPSFQW